jgi:hypothetical protein
VTMRGRDTTTLRTCTSAVDGIRHIADRYSIEYILVAGACHILCLSSILQTPSYSPLLYSIATSLDPL